MHFCCLFCSFVPMEKLISLIRDIAKVPSFSSYEEHIHDLIFRSMESVPGADGERVPDNNLVFQVPGDDSRAPVALTAHLDKINHFGASPPEVLPFEQDEERLTGQLDNAVGLALCIALARISAGRSFPPLMLLFSEMEESFGLKNHPHLLKNEGKGLYNGMGAERIARYLKREGLLPSAVITLDTTPLFKGDPGVALYSGHWEFTGQQPTDRERERTERVRDQFLSIDPDLYLSNNTNDYLHYGAELNRGGQTDIPSLALEPAIFPYHQKNESVYLKDIARVHDIMVRWLEQSGQGI
ncbi:MAG: M28 family peptidase [Balneolaceae bacterium]|nr:MAG: M28 family peptidase [Balneolaceae bacterium]